MFPLITAPGHGRKRPSDFFRRLHARGVFHPRIKVKAQALRDEKAKVFVPVSEDFLPAFACVAEAETLCSLYDALQSVFADGFETIFGKEAKFPAVTASLVLSSRDGNR